MEPLLALTTCGMWRHTMVRDKTSIMSGTSGSSISLPLRLRSIPPWASVASRSLTKPYKIVQEIRRPGADRLYAPACNHFGLRRQWTWNPRDAGFGACTAATTGFQCAIGGVNPNNPGFVVQKPIGSSTCTLRSRLSSCRILLILSAACGLEVSYALSSFKNAGGLSFTSPRLALAIRTSSFPPSTAPPTMTKPSNESALAPACIVSVHHASSNGASG